MDHNTQCRLLHAAKILTHLKSLGILAAVTGSVALFVHGMSRTKPPGDIDVVVWGTNGYEIRDSLVASNPNNYSIAANKLVYKHDEQSEGSVVELLCASSNATLRWLQFGHNQVEEIEGIKMLTMGQLLRISYQLPTPDCKIFALVEVSKERKTRTMHS